MIDCLSVGARPREQGYGVAEEELSYSELHEVRAHNARNHAYRGQALVSLGRLREGIEEIIKGLAIFKEARTALGVSAHVANLARAYLLVGDSELAYRTIVPVISELAASEEHRVLPEAYRIKGEIAQTLRDHMTEAPDCFERAVAIGRAQGAKSYELRATTSLARLLATQGKRDEARAMLAEIYNWFTEGFDTADLKDAKALLDELNV